ncbi:MAG: MlaD family protein [Planctomycetota bacterium]
MASREEKVTAGFFVLVGLVLIIVTVALIAGFRLRRSENVYYVNITESVYGMDEESTVFFQGKPAGRVKAIEFTKDISTIRVVLGLNPDLPVKVTTRATLKQHFVTNKTIIELIGGKNEDANLRPESLIQWQETGLMVVQRSVPELLSKISDSLDALGGVLSRENVARFGRIMDNIDKTLAAVPGDVERMSHATDGLIGEARQAVADVQDLTRSTKGSLTRLEGELQGTLQSTRGLVDQTRADLDPTVRRVTQVVDQLAQVGNELAAFAQRANQLMGPTADAVKRAGALITRTDELIVENRTEIADALNSIRRTARALELVLLQLEQNPGVLLFSAQGSEREVPDR